MVTLFVLGMVAVAVVVGFAALLAAFKLLVLLVLLPLKFALKLVLLPVRLVLALVLLPVFLLFGVLGAGVAALFAVPLLPLALLGLLVWLLMRRAPSATTPPAA